MLDVFIEYIANCHILYSGQLKFRLSVYHSKFVVCTWTTFVPKRLCIRDELFVLFQFSFDWM